MNLPAREQLQIGQAARTIALQMLEERGRGAVLVGVAQVDAALRDDILLIMILVAFLEATALPLSPQPPAMVMGLTEIHWSGDGRGHDHEKANSLGC